jgi:hypothetical protein
MYVCNLLMMNNRVYLLNFFITRGNIKVQLIKQILINSSMKHFSAKTLFLTQKMFLGRKFFLLKKYKIFDI